MTVVIDSHQHCWQLGRAPYSWLTPSLGPLYRTVDFDELVPQLAQAGVQHTVLVQSDDNDQDNQYLFEVAEAHPEVAAVVAWLPLAEPEKAAPMLAELQARPNFKGVRVGINHQDDVEWLLRPEVGESLSLLEAEQVPFDVVSVRRRHLELVSEVAERHPDLRLVIDHLSKPPVKRDDAAFWGPWRQNLARAAEHPNVYAKVSGLFPARGDMDDWDADDIKPVVDYAVETFGHARLMYGSDWPISELAGGYLKVWRELGKVFAPWAPQERDAVLGATAAEFYGLRPQAH